MKYVAILLALVVLTIGYFLVRKWKSHNTNHQLSGTKSNVISMDSHRKAKHSSGEQLCTSCRKKNGKLIFYAQDNGTVVGLCKDCQSKAKKRDMLPL